MLKRWALRLIAYAFLVLTIYCGTRLLVRALPGDPIEAIVAESGTSIPVEVLRAEMNLDKPFLQGLGEDLGKARHGDLGRSLLSKEPVAPVLFHRFVRTVQLSWVALCLGLSLSLALGLAAAAKPQGIADRLCTFHGAFSAALPTPWIGPILLLVFAVWLPVFPTGGSVILPAITLAIVFSGLWARLIRERVRETLIFGAAQGARARGLPEWKVLLKYGFAPASGALVAYLGSQLGALLAGAFVTEVVFGWPGMGSLFVDAVLKRDYPMVESATFVSAAAALGGTLLGDIYQEAFQKRQTGL